MVYDKRLVERLVRNGEITQEEVDEFHAGLTDVADNATETETQLGAAPAVEPVAEPTADEAAPQ